MNDDELNKYTYTSRFMKKDGQKAAQSSERKLSILKIYEIKGLRSAAREFLIGQ